MTDIEKLHAYVDCKREFDSIFPGFIMRIGEAVTAGLSVKYPRVECHPGPVSYRWFANAFPDTAEPFGHPNWICFGFPDSGAEEKHAGVVFKLDSWPFTYSVGVHISPKLFFTKRDIMETMAQRYAMQYRDAGIEHQYNLAEAVLDVCDLDGELEKICKKLCEVYAVFDPILR